MTLKRIIAKDGNRKSNRKVAEGEQWDGGSHEQLQQKVTYLI